MILKSWWLILALYQPVLAIFRHAAQTPMVDFRKHPWQMETDYYLPKLSDPGLHFEEKFFQLGGESAGFTQSETPPGSTVLLDKSSKGKGKLSDLIPLRKKTGQSSATDREEQGTYENPWISALICFGDWTSGYHDPNAHVPPGGKELISLKFLDLFYNKGATFNLGPRVQVYGRTNPAAARILREMAMNVWPDEQRVQYQTELVLHYLLHSAKDLQPDEQLMWIQILVQLSRAQPQAFDGVFAQFYSSVWSQFSATKFPQVWFRALLESVKQRYTGRVFRLDDQVQEHYKKTDPALWSPIYGAGDPDEVGKHIPAIIESTWPHPQNNFKEQFVTSYYSPQGITMLNRMLQVYCETDEHMSWLLQAIGSSSGLDNRPVAGLTRATILYLMRTSCATISPNRYVLWMDILTKLSFLDPMQFDPLFRHNFYTLNQRLQQGVLETTNYEMSSLALNWLHALHEVVLDRRNVIPPGVFPLYSPLAQEFLDPQQELPVILTHFPTFKNFAQFDRKLEALIVRLAGPTSEKAKTSFMQSLSEMVQAEAPNSITSKTASLALLHFIARRRTLLSTNYPTARLHETLIPLATQYLQYLTGDAMEYLTINHLKLHQVLTTFYDEGHGGHR